MESTSCGFLRQQSRRLSPRDCLGATSDSNLMRPKRYISDLVGCGLPWRSAPRGIWILGQVGLLVTIVITFLWSLRGLRTVLSGDPGALSGAVALSQNVGAGFFANDYGFSVFLLQADSSNGGQRFSLNSGFPPRRGSPMRLTE